jgi:hypothetical protein
VPDVFSRLARARRLARGVWGDNTKVRLVPPNGAGQTVSVNPVRQTVIARANERNLVSAE